MEISALRKQLGSVYRQHVPRRLPRRCSRELRMIYVYTYITMMTMMGRVMAGAKKMLNGGKKGDGDFVPERRRIVWLFFFSPFFCREMSCSSVDRVLWGDNFFFDNSFCSAVKLDIRAHFCAAYIEESLRRRNHFGGGFPLKIEPREYSYGRRNYILQQGVTIPINIAR